MRKRRSQYHITWKADESLKKIPRARALESCGKTPRVLRDPYLLNRYQTGQSRVSKRRTNVGHVVEAHKRRIEENRSSGTDCLAGRRGVLRIEVLRHFIEGVRPKSTFRQDPVVGVF